MTYDPNRASEVLKLFTFRDVVQGRVAIEESLSENADNTSALPKSQGHAPASPLNDSFIFLLKAGNVQPAKGELHFTIFPHHQMHHGPSSPNKADGAGNQKRLPNRHLNQNRTTTITSTTTGGRGGTRSGSTVTTAHNGGINSLPPHILSHKSHNRTQHRTRYHGRWGNHTRGGSHGGRSEGASEGTGRGRGRSPQPHTPSAVDKHNPGTGPDPLHVEILPRPASDPLLIILPLLACLLLIVILIVLILVFRHRKEKQARQRLMQQLVSVTSPAEGNPYLAQAERSTAVPSVVVTPLQSARSCPTSPKNPMSHRRRSLAPGMTFWGPLEAEEPDIGDEDIKGVNRSEGVACGTTSAGFRTSLRSNSLTPTLRHGQFWV